MKKILAVIICSVLFASCATTTKRLSALQQTTGAVLVTAGAVGGAYAGAEIAKNNNASDTGSAFIAVGTSLGLAFAVGYVYDLVLDVLNLKEDVPADTKVYEEKETPDFMLQKN